MSRAARAMGRPGPGGPGTDMPATDGASPVGDEVLLRRWSAALAAWSAAGRGATSSITGGGAVEALEEAFSLRHRGRPCLAVGSGTAALVAALHAVGVRAGDRVLTPVLDWTAATEAIRVLGAEAVYVDIDPDTLTMDPAAAGAASAGARAVVATHLFGIPADVPALASATRLPVVEDCAQALGALLDGRPVGTLGDAAAFSLGPGKHVDAGEGGVVCTATDDLVRAVAEATQHPVRRLRLGADPIAASVLSSRIHPFAAVLGWAELGGLDERLEQRLSAAESIAGLVAVGDARRSPAWWRYPVLTGDGAPSGVAPLHPDAGRYPAAHAAAARLRLARGTGGPPGTATRRP